jgi:hypothetical protein
MVTFEAPHPAITTTLMLPNPQFSNSEALTSSLSLKRATDGTLYTYVKTKNGRRKLLWTFTLARNRALALRAFIQSYHASKIRVTDHEGRIWVGNVTSNPVEFDSVSRDLQSVTLEFEGVEQ